MCVIFQTDHKCLLRCQQTVTVFISRDKDSYLTAGSVHIFTPTAGAAPCLFADNQKQVSLPPSFPAFLAQEIFIIFIIFIMPYRWAWTTLLLHICDPHLVDARGQPP